MTHTFQILKIPPEYTMQYSVQPGRNTKNEAYNSQSVILGTQITLPKRMGNNTIFLFQKV